MKTRRPRVLVLYWNPPGNALRGAIESHLRSLERLPNPPEVIYANTWDGGPQWLSRLRPDALVLHTTFLCVRWSHLFPTWKWRMRWISDLDRPKIALPQDEYDHAHVLDEWLAELGVDVIVSNFGEAQRATLYPSGAGGATFVRGFTGYIDETAAVHLASTLRRHPERPLDVVYRASHLPYWFGSQGQLKHVVGSVVGDRAAAAGYAVDISTRYDDTILGLDWLSFLASGRIVLGCESGSSVLDRRGEVRATLQTMLANDPDLTFEEANARMPDGWDRYRFFALSPRNLEAVITKTCQVLVEGRYDDVLEPGRHYVSLRRDFSNLDDVIEEIADPRRSEELAAAAYEDVYRSGLYNQSALADLIVQELDLHPAYGSGGVVWPTVRAAERAAGAVSRASRKRFRLGHRRPSVSRVAIRTLRRRLGSPLLTAQLAGMQLRVLAEHPELRVIALDMVRNGQSDPRITDDLLRLAILASALKKRRHFLIDAIWDSQEQRLIFRSRLRGTSANTGALPEEAVGRVVDVVWDHSEVATWVEQGILRNRTITVSIGDEGIYVFHAVHDALARSRRARSAVFALAHSGGESQ